MGEANKDKGHPRLARLPATNATHDNAKIQTIGGMSVMTEQKPKCPPCLFPGMSYLSLMKYISQ